MFLVRRSVCLVLIFVPKSVESLAYSLGKMYFALSIRLEMNNLLCSSDLR